MDVWEKKIKTITALEKQVGKKRFAELFSDLVHKPAGKPALVPDTDKRPAMSLGRLQTSNPFKLIQKNQSLKEKTNEPQPYSSCHRCCPTVFC